MTAKLEISDERLQELYPRLTKIGMRTLANELGCSAYGLRSAFIRAGFDTSNGRGRKGHTGRDPGRGWSNRVAVGLLKKPLGISP
jgi:hypothetical protein